MSKYKEAEQRLGRGDKIKSTSVRSLTKSSVKQWNSGQNRVSCKNGSQGGGRCFSPLFISASFISTLTFVGNNSHFYCSRATALDLLGRELMVWLLCGQKLARQGLCFPRQEPKESLCLNNLWSGLFPTDHIPGKFSLSHCKIPSSPPWLLSRYHCVPLIVYYGIET